MKLKLIDEDKVGAVLAALEFQRAQAQSREEQLRADIKRLTQAVVDVASFEHRKDFEVKP